MSKSLKRKTVFTILASFVLAGSLLFSSCGLSQTSAEHTPNVTVNAIQKTYSDELNDVFTVFYSDGTTGEFTVENKKQIQNEQPPTTGANSVAKLNQNLLSSLKIYTFFNRTVTGYIGFRPTTTTETVRLAGSAVVYDMQAEYTYILTNYHVVYYYYGHSKISNDIHVYLYGSEYTPTAVSKNSDGTTNYEFGGMDVSCEYIGGSPSCDIAVLRAKTSDLLNINPAVHAVTTSNEYYVGQNVIAIGNASDEGISATKGIVGVADEFINLSVDGTTRTYRSLRIDAAIYNGNSGGGLFNENGELIGITNSGEGTSGQNINYAIPAPIVTGIADNIIYYHKTSDMGVPKVVTFGVNIRETGIRYAYDVALGYGKSTAQIEITGTSGLATKAGLQTNDVLTAISINGAVHKLNRSYDISDLAMTVRAGDQISFTYLRGGNSITSPAVTVVASDLSDYS